MSPLTKIASFTALSLSLATVGAGCMAQTDAEEDETTAAPDPQPAEKTGEAHEAWFPFFSHFFLPCACTDPDWACLGIPAPFFNGCGFPIARCF